MNKITLTAVLFAAMTTGCAAHPPAGNYHAGCEAAYLRYKDEGPALERDLRDCLHGEFNLRNPKCLDTRRFAAFSGDAHMIRTCLDAGMLRPPLHEARKAAINMKSIAKLAGKLGDMAATQGL